MADSAGGRVTATPYDENASDQRWLDELNQWTWQQVPGTHRWQTKGRCPRCRHETELEVEATVSLAPSAFPGSSGRLIHSPPATVEFRCFCDETHKKGKTGCGLRIPGMRGP
ncbi:hypothetical protein GCM10025871_36600 [Deinococcus metallilatus]|nr:hypothetical protein GCM10025871_36600 [Deinococcus metallilatus]